MTDVGPDGLPAQRTPGTVVVAVLAGVLLALSAIWLVYASSIVWTGGNDATCTNVKPDRHVGMIVGISIVGYLALVVPAVVLLRKKEFEWAFAALILAFIALVEPCGGIGWILFSIGMC